MILIVRPFTEMLSVSATINWSQLAEGANLSIQLEPLSKFCEDVLGVRAMFSRFDAFQPFVDCNFEISFLQISSVLFIYKTIFVWECAIVCYP